MAKSVLIVDDAFFMRSYIKNVLEEAGFVVCGDASNGPQAVERYKELKPDLVTMDIVMPRIEELDGIGAVKMIIDFDASAKIIVASALSQKSLIDDATASGAKGFIVKPFKPEELVKLANQALED